MDAGTIYVKTEKGDQELKDRSFGLPAGLRHVLILVDGKSSVQKIMEKGAGLPGIDQSLAELDKQGYIRCMEHSIAEIKQEMISTARAVLGDNAEKIVKKIQEAPDTSEALSLAMANCKKYVKLVIDEAKADELEVKCAEIKKRYNL